MKILVADDDERILRLLSDYLKFNQYEVVTVTDGKQALETFRADSFDLVILDIMMPIYDGWFVCKAIRQNSEVPVIILTAKDSDLDQLHGFDIGADDYIAKPFNIALVLARVKRLLKDTKNDAIDKVLRFKEIEIDEEKHEIRISGEIVELSPKEYELLVYFMKHLNRVISRETLLQVIWGDEYFGDTRTVDTHINRLRNKLDSHDIYLKTVRGFGYKLGEEG